MKTMTGTSGRMARAALCAAALLGTAHIRALAQEEERQVYVADLRPMNESVSPTGEGASGRAEFVVEGNTLTITVEAEGLAPGTMHLQHYHGFPDGRDAVCPPAQADIDRDGLIDLVETEPYAGTTLVPFHEDPTSLEITAETYPVASESGRISYRETVELDGLQQAVQRKYGIDGLQLEDRVVFLHGISADRELPPSVQSLPGVPAHVTLPVACGEIRRVR